MLRFEGRRSETIYGLSANGILSDYNKFERMGNYCQKDDDYELKPSDDHRRSIRAVRSKSALLPCKIKTLTSTAC
jgi:hypothetical protein